MEPDDELPPEAEADPAEVPLAVPVEVALADPAEDPVPPPSVPAEDAVPPPVLVPPSSPQPVSARAQAKAWTERCRRV